MSLLGMQVQPSVLFKTLAVGTGIAVFSFLAGMWSAPCNAAEAKAKAPEAQIETSHEKIPDQPDGTGIMLVTDADGKVSCHVFTPEGVDLSRRQRFWNWVKERKCKVQSYFRHDEDEKKGEPKQADPPPVAAVQS